MTSNTQHGKWDSYALLLLLLQSTYDSSSSLQMHTYTDSLSQACLCPIKFPAVVLKRVLQRVCLALASHPFNMYMKEATRIVPDGNGNGNDMTYTCDEIFFLFFFLLVNKASCEKRN